MTVCPENKCLGCGLCASLCPHGCISMRENDLGELHPFVDESACTSCSLCIRMCPANDTMVFHEPLACYAAQNTDSEELKGSSSGGIGALLASAFPETAFGTTVNENLEAVVKRGCARDFKGSKYVQSIISPDVYREIKNTAGKSPAIFIGTPCQVAAVKSMCGASDNLVTVDLLCHGVCPPSYLKEELSPILAKLPAASQLSFRNGSDYRLAISDDSGNVLYSCPALKQHYFRAYMEGVSLREICYSCPFAREERISDITIGDFIGREGQVSFVSANSAKGQALLEEIRASHPEFWMEPCGYEERKAYPYSISRPFPKSRLRKSFVRTYREKGYTAAMKKLARRWLMQNSAISLYRRIHHIAHLTKMAIAEKL